MGSGKEELAVLGWRMKTRACNGETWEFDEDSRTYELTIANYSLSYEPQCWTAETSWYNNYEYLAVPMTEDVMRAALKRIEELKARDKADRLRYMEQEGRMIAAEDRKTCIDCKYFDTMPGNMYGVCIIDSRIKGADDFELAWFPCDDAPCMLFKEMEP